MQSSAVDKIGPIDKCESENYFFILLARRDLYVSDFEKLHKLTFPFTSQLSLSL